MNLDNLVEKSRRRRTIGRLQVIQHDDENARRLRGRPAYELLRDLGTSHVTFEQGGTPGSYCNPMIRIITSTLLTTEYVQQEASIGPGRYYLSVLDHTTPTLDFNCEETLWIMGGEEVGQPNNFDPFPIRAGMQQADMITFSYQKAAEQAEELGLPAYHVPDLQSDELADMAVYIHNMSHAIHHARVNARKRLTKAGVKLTWKERAYRRQVNVVSRALLQLTADNLEKGAA